VLGLHLGIASTLKIPFINLALMGVAVIYFRDEIMQRARARWRVPASGAAPVGAALDPRAYIGCATIGLLLLHFLG
jgi:hypothetical protein